jgi:hypothetical protein
MAVIAVVPLGRAATFTLAAIAPGGDTVENDGSMYLHVNNAGGTPTTITVSATRACSHQQLHSFVAVVANGTNRIIGPFPISKFGQLLSLVYSGNTASVTIGAHRGGGLVG